MTRTGQAYIVLTGLVAVALVAVFLDSRGERQSGVTEAKYVTAAENLFCKGLRAVSGAPQSRPRAVDYRHAQRGRHRSEDRVQGPRRD